MTTLVESPLPIAGPNFIINPLPFSLDSSCPINLPSKPLTAGTYWPYQIAGPSTLPEESQEDFMKRRYYETLYLSETLSPLSGFAADLFRLSNDSSPSFGQLGELIKPLLLSLPEIEKRHRKVILPILTYSKDSPSTEELDEIERNVIKFAAELRLGSRQALDDGIIPLPKKLSDELEKRETLMQLILLMIYSTQTPDPIQPPKKRKRSKLSRRTEPDSPIIVNPKEDPKTALELLIDRLSVWQAVSELGLSLDIPPMNNNSSNNKGKSKSEENSISNLLGRFWKNVMIPFFLSKQPDLCSIFHLKVFGHPLPPKLLPPPTTKKPRKPKLTKPILSKDSLIPPPPIYERPRSISNEGIPGLNLDRQRSLSRVSSRAGSRGPSESGSFRTSPPPPPSRENSSNLKRSLSRTNTETTAHNIGGLSRSRSRSQSTDPLTRSESLSRSLSTSLTTNHLNSNKQGLTRNKSSGKDLFKSREVGLMRRSISSRKSEILERTESLNHSQNQSQSSRFGLLGRKTSAGKDGGRKNSIEESQKPNTLILATPSKPRNHLNPFSRSNQSQSQTQIQFQSQFSSWIPPTPIHEGPSGINRPSYIAETPIAPMRIATKDTLPLNGHEEDDGMESDDPLGELWELTDDEDDGDVGGKGREMVPETPMK